ncbi:MAG: hypothetical protein PHS57_06180 [Alphaproteobacteria bacterium]|nr:hypothetical protein [Alphaproteobacteria bacterium]
MKEIIARVRDVGGAAEWTESVVVPDGVDGSEYFERLIQTFNDTFMPGERPRELIRVEEMRKNAIGKHAWEKSSLVTQRDRRGQYDAYRCKNCGITGKRRSLPFAIERDPKYKAKKYEGCPGREQG